MYNAEEDEDDDESSEVATEPKLEEWDLRCVMICRNQSSCGNMSSPVGFEPNIPYNAIKKERLLGSGSFADVYMWYELSVPFTPVNTRVSRWR